MKLIEYGKNEAHPLIRLIRTHRHHRNSTLLHAVNKFRKSFQSEI